MKAEESKEIERNYRRWIRNHPKGEDSYNSYNHIHRSVDFAKHYANQRVIEELEKQMELAEIGNSYTRLRERIKELK